MRLQTKTSVLLLSTSLLFSIFCKPQASILEVTPEPKERARPNVIWIVIDSLRGDVIGRYGITPVMDSFALNACDFRNHFVNATWTRPSTIVFFTGKYASRSPVNFWDYPTPTSEVRSFYEKELYPLPKYLSQNGIYTAMVGNNPFLTDKSGLGVNVGFDELYDFSHLSNDTPSITRKSLATIEERANLPLKETPFLLLINFNDPHKPYTPPAGYTQRINTLEILDDRKRDYLGEVAYIDDQLDLIFRKLKEKKLWDNSAIIITADHGEVMNIDHSISPFTGTNTYFGHGQDLFLENIHVPLLVKLPYQKIGKKMVSRTQSVDLYPFVLELFHLPVMTKIDGISLTQVIDGKQKNNRLYYGETRATQGVAIGDDFLYQRSYRFHELGKFWSGGVGRESFYYYNAKADPSQILPIKFASNAELIERNINTTLQNTILSLTQALRSIEPKIPVYTIRFNLKGQHEKDLRAEITIPAGQLRIKKKMMNSKILVDYSARKLVLKYNRTQEKFSDESEEISFEVYPDVVFPKFQFFRNGIDVTKSSTGIGIFDLTLSDCYPTCEELYAAPLGSPTQSKLNSFQVWQTGGDMKDYVRDTKLETDALDILKKQGYVQ